MTAAPAGIDAVHPHAPGPQFMVDRDADGNEVPHAVRPTPESMPTYAWRSLLVRCPCGQACLNSHI